MEIRAGAEIVKTSYWKSKVYGKHTQSVNKKRKI
jgi:hypothetical protein